MAKPGELPENTAPDAPATLPTADVVLAPPPPALSRGATVGRYVIEEPLGEGGMGVVYTAHDPELGRLVALKLLRVELTEAGEGSGGRSRLVREAHAMAKLSHPNVVAIYDAGVYRDQVFLAVERVDGTTLKGWLRAAPRSWREVLAVLLQAGRGLAAAHAAGLVHRDFKPENVLIGKGGEVKVADFGLARAVVSPGGNGPTEHSSVTVEDLASDPVLATPLTRAGLIAGTPAYMAPEQFRGLPGDARTDEFSFSVAVYRSLYGEPPFEGRPDARAPSRVRPAPKGTSVPAWVRRALLRGLAIAPEDRYPTLADLLAALSDDPAVRHRRMLAAAGVAALVVGAIAVTASIGFRQRAAADPCHDPDRELAGVWDDTVRTRVRAAFAGSGAPEAASTAAYAETAMDRASAAWLAAYRDACDATRLRHTQPEAALRLRLDCLDDQRFGLRAAAEIMSHPDAKNLSSAIGAGSTLPLPVECTDARVLSVVETPSPEHRGEADALRQRLAMGRALIGAAQFRDALAVLDGLPEAAGSVGAASLQANAHEALAEGYGELNDYDQAIASYTRAESVAAAAHMEELATQAAAALVVYEDMNGSPLAEVRRSLDRAREDLRRAGSGTAAEFYVLRAAGFAGATGEPGDVHTHRVLDLAERLFGSDRPETLHAANEHAISLMRRGQYDESVALLRRTIASADAIFGPHNQRALLPLVNLAQILFALGRATDAAQAVDDVLARLGSEERIHAAVALAVRAAIQSERGQWAESLRTARLSLDMAERLHMLANANWGLDLHRHTIEAYLRDHQPAVAVDEYDRFLLAAGVNDGPDAIDSLRLGGWAYLDAGQPEKALPLLERALGLGAARPYYPTWVARLKYQVAQAVAQTRGDLERAEALAQASRDELAAADSAMAKELLAEVDGWRRRSYHHAAETVAPALPSSPVPAGPSPPTLAPARRGEASAAPARSPAPPTPVTPRRRSASYDHM